MKSFSRRIIPTGAKGTPSFRRTSEALSAADSGVSGIDKVLVGDCSSAAMQRAMAKVAAANCETACKLPQEDGPEAGYLSQDTTPAALAAGNTTLTFTPEGDDKFLGAELVICMLLADVPNVVIASIKINRKEFVRGNNFIPVCQFTQTNGCGDDFELTCWATERTPITMVLTNLTGAATTGKVTVAWKGVYSASSDC